MRVRYASQRDIPRSEAIINQHWKVSVDHHKELENPNAIFLVAELTGRNALVVGTALMWITKWNKTGYLVELAVDKKHQGKGIGSMLVDRLASRARKKGLRAIIVETQFSNSEAMSFYTKKGFRLCGYNDRYYTNAPKTLKQVAVFLSLDL